MAKCFRWVLSTLLVLVSAAVCVSSPSTPAAASTTYVERGSGFVSLEPVRLVDTRSGLGVPAGPVPAGRSIDVTVAGRAGVPASGVAAVALNVTVTGPAGSGYLTAFPSGTVRPVASNLNFVSGVTAANQVLVKVGAGGRITLYSSQRTHVVVDLAGYYPAAGDNYEALDPARVLDTRSGVGASAGLVSAGGTVALRVTGRGGVPATEVGAVVLNVTVTAPQAAGYVTVFPGGGSRPTASNVNYAKGQTVAGLVVAKVGSGGEVSLFTSGSAHLIADVAGYLPVGSDYTGLTPARLVDTRTGVGAPKGTVAAGRSVTVAVLGVGGTPIDQVSAVSLNVTATGPIAGGYVTVYPAGTTRPTASMLNYRTGQTVANSIIAKPGADGRITLFTSAATHLVVDVGGFISSPLDVVMEQPASTQVEEAAEVIAVDAPTSDGGAGSYTLESGQPVPAVGNHVFLPPGSGNGDGLIGRVTHTSGQLVEVVSVPLEEAFPAGHIEGTADADNVLVQAATQRRANSRSAVQLDCRDEDGNPVGNGVEIGVELSLGTRLTAFMDWGPSKQAHLRVSATVSLDATVTVAIYAKVSCSFEGPRVPGPPVGVVFTTSIASRTTLELSAGVQAGARWTGASYTTGIEWKDGSQPTTFSSLATGKWEIDPPSVRSALAKVELTTGPVAEFKLAGLTGIELFAGGFLAFTVAPAQSPWWKLSAGVKVSAALEVNIIFVIDTRYELATRVLIETELARATTPYTSSGPPVITTTRLPDATVNTFYSTTLGTADGRTGTWTISSGANPPGLSVTSTGTIRGTPQDAGRWTFTIRFTDSSSRIAERTYTLAVSSGSTESNFPARDAPGVQSFSIVKNNSSFTVPWIYNLKTPRSLSWTGALRLECISNTADGGTRNLTIQRDGRSAEAATSACGERVIDDQLGRRFETEPDGVGVVAYDRDGRELWKNPNVVSVWPTADGGSYPILTLQNSTYFYGVVEPASGDFATFHEIGRTDFADWVTTFGNTITVMSDSQAIWIDRTTGTVLRRVGPQLSEVVPSNGSALFSSQRSTLGSGDSCQAITRKEDDTGLLWSVTTELTGGTTCRYSLLPDARGGVYIVMDRSDYPKPFVRRLWYADSNGQLNDLGNLPGGSQSGDSTDVTADSSGRLAWPMYEDATCPEWQDNACYIARVYVRDTDGSIRVVRQQQPTDAASPSGRGFVLFGAEQLWFTFDAEARTRSDNPRLHVESVPMATDGDYLVTRTFRR